MAQSTSRVVIRESVPDHRDLRDQARDWVRANFLTRQTDAIRLFLSLKFAEDKGTEKAWGELAADLAKLEDRPRKET